MSSQPASSEAGVRAPSSKAPTLNPVRVLPLSGDDAPNRTPRDPVNSNICSVGRVYNMDCIFFVEILKGRTLHRPEWYWTQHCREIQLGKECVYIIP